MSSPKHRFFCKNPSDGILDEDESAHAIRVLRMQPNDVFELLDGNGNKYVCKITETTKRQVRFLISECESQTQRFPDIHIAIAPTKNIDRFEFFLEKSTEIGITKITPILTKNSERHEIKTEKLRKNIVSAVKQSGNLFLPELSEIIPFHEFLKTQTNNQTQKYIAHCESDADKNPLIHALLPSKNVVILIGPEGDFTHTEIEAAKAAGFVPVSLGDSRLRTETAGVAACLTVHLKK